MMQSPSRLPPETRDLLVQITRTVRDEIVPFIPGGPPERVQAHVTELVLAVALQDWYDNGNQDGLVAQDVADFRSFIELAHGVAGKDPWGRGNAVFDATLKGLLQDWLENWNAPGHPGPPRRG